MLDNPYALETLPADDTDLSIPTRVANIDEYLISLKSDLATLEQKIREVESERNTMISRAKELSITTDSNYKLVEVPVYPNKRVDVEVLKKLDPIRYVQILQNIRSKISDKANADLERAQTFVSQADVKAVIKDKGLLAQIIPEPSTPARYITTIVKR